MRTEPPVSVPIPPGIMRAATATAVPPLDPPGIIDRSQGLRAAPVTALLFVTPEGELVHVRLRAEERARLEEGRRDRCVPLRDEVREGAGGAARREGGRRDVVLEGEGNAVERDRGHRAGPVPEPPSTARAAASSSSQSCETNALRSAIASHRATSASTYSRHEHARSRSAAAASAAVSSMRSVSRTAPAPRHRGSGAVPPRGTAPRSHYRRRIEGSGILETEDSSNLELPDFARAGDSPP